MTEKQPQVLRFKFALAREQEKILWAYINSSVKMHKAKFKDSGSQSVRDKRLDFRITFDQPLRVELDIAATGLIAEQSVPAKIIDLSMGGCCLAIDPTIKVGMHQEAWVKLDFVHPPLRVASRILEVRKK